MIPSAAVARCASSFQSWDSTLLEDGHLQTAGNKYQGNARHWRPFLSDVEGTVLLPSAQKALYFGC